MCEPGYIEWIHTAFGECVISERDKWSFAIGMVSNIMWIVSSSPQIYQNCVTKKVEGQSPFLFSLLETGNIRSLIGVIINHGLVTQIITSALYALLDGIMFTQYLYYRFCNKQKVQFTEDDDNDKKSEQSSSSDMQVSGLASMAGVSLAQAKTDWTAPYSNEQLVGTLFGWIGGCVYIGSRIPQVLKNFQNRKVIDLSPIYVCFTIFGNLTYCLSVFIKSLDGSYLWNQAPFLFGAMGPMFCDILFLIQMAIFGIQKGDKQ